MSRERRCRRCRRPGTAAGGCVSYCRSTSGALIGSLFEAIDNFNGTKPDWEIGMRPFIVIALLAVAGCASQQETGERQRVVIAESGGSENFRPPPEFRTRKHGDSTVYCRKEVHIGSRFEDWVCYTEAHLKALLERQKSMQDEIGSRQRTCGTPAACAGQ